MTSLQQRDPNARAQLSIVAAAVNGLTKADLQSLHAWQPLAALSPRTAFEGIDVDMDSIILRDDGSFEAVADIYVKLDFTTGAVSPLGDSYPAIIHGLLANGQANVQRVTVNADASYI